MAIFEIKHRYTGAVLYSGEGETLRAVVISAVASRAYLTGANLTRADLTGADLTGAYLADADLADAYLTGADLTGADLTDADLTDADLTDADLTDADLTDARNIPEIDEVADPAVPYKRATTEAEREQRRLDRMTLFRARNPDVPVIEQLDRKILDAVTNGGGSLEMGSWHRCDTTHCRAGWAIHLAGKPGYDLEHKYGSQHAGRMLYIASTGRAPHFFATNERALEDIKACAAADA